MVGEIKPYYSVQCIVSILYRYVTTNLLKICIIKFDAMKIIFNKFAGF